ncbi:MAG: carbamoyl-phosphate synthase small subunit [Candidatus Omnitrophota bacterium]|jgi:carbamoyl-phosphate synthase small subunit
MTDAILALESGLIFKGQAFGDIKNAEGEVVFNTAMTGYQEVITDPSYKGQMVCMTYPLIGNYGINSEDMESRACFLSGFIVKELSRIVSNHRADRTLDAYLKEQGIVGIQGIDTRALTLHLRTHGAQKGIISISEKDPEKLIRMAKDSKSIVGVDLVQEVMQDKPYQWTEEGKYHIVAIDSGIKLNILRCFAKLNCKVTVLPATAPAHDILKLNPDGLFLSNGPGDPEQVDYLIYTVKQLLNKLPIFGICLGHQILGQALGAKTYKLKFGHHGANHPVMDLTTGKVEITSQNHGFAIDPDSIPGDKVKVTHISLNDQTCEGIEHTELPLFSVQYHPEAAPGPHDSGYLFERFIQKIEAAKQNA